MGTSAVPTKKCGCFLFLWLSVTHVFYFIFTRNYPVVARRKKINEIKKACFENENSGEKNVEVHVDRAHHEKYRMSQSSSLNQTFPDANESLDIRAERRREFR